MARLTKDEIARYALAHGKIYEQMCDEDECGHLLVPGELCVVLKSVPREDGVKFLSRIPTKIRCMGCQALRTPPREEVNVKGAGRGAKKVTQEQAADLAINPLVRRTVIRLLKKLPPKQGITKPDMLAKLRKSKAIRELKKREVSKTLQSMKKLGLIVVRQKTWQLPKEKAKKRAKKKVAKKS